MLLAEAVEGAVGGDQPAVHRPIRLSEAASNFSLWLFGPFLPYLIAEYYYILLLTLIRAAVCIVIQMLFCNHLIYFMVDSATTITLDISADHVRVKLRCYDWMTCTSNTNSC